MKVHTASDYEFNAWIVKPADFDPSKKYPVMMTQYSGPNSQQVLVNTVSIGSNIWPQMVLSWYVWMVVEPVPVVRHSVNVLI